MLKNAFLSIKKIIDRQDSFIICNNDSNCELELLQVCQSRVLRKNQWSKLEHHLAMM